MESGFTYSTNNAKLIETLKEDFYANRDQYSWNRGNQNYIRHLGTTKEFDIGNWGVYFWEDHKDIFDYLNQITYPRSSDYIIDKSWMKYYPEETFSGLHTENGDPCIEIDQYTNVILIDQSKDIVGGIIVIAGDSMEFTKDPSKNGNIRERLLTRFLEKPGDAIVWDAYAVHGVSKIEKGHRLVLVCIKSKMER